MAFGHCAINQKREGKESASQRHRLKISDVVFLGKGLFRCKSWIVRKLNQRKRRHMIVGPGHR